MVVTPIANGREHAERCSLMNSGPLGRLGANAAYRRSWARAPRIGGLGLLPAADRPCVAFRDHAEHPDTPGNRLVSLFGLVERAR